MALFNFENKLDGTRLSLKSRASVQANGNLSFSSEATRMMGLSLEKGLWMSPMNEKDLAVVVTDREAENAFPMKKSGPYFYVPFRTYMEEKGVAFKENRVIYDIIPTNETYEGNVVYKFNFRLIEHGENEEADDESQTPETL